VAMFAALNPWVYSEYVAGHIFMVLAYALLLALLAETRRHKPREWILIILAGLLVIQIEFFLLAVIPFLVWCWRHRILKPAAATLIAAMPLALGIVALFPQILATPYLLSWQSAQSVPLNEGWLLLGYQFHYAAEFDRIRIALFCYGVLGIVGAWICVRNRRDIVTLSLSLTCLIFATGTTWAIAPLYSFLVVNFTESGVFRELYDLIGLVAIGYVVALSATARHVIAVGVLVALSAVLTAPWLTRPISSFVVDALAIPPAPLAKSPQTRTALYPAFQPLQFRHRGSGYDPDAYNRSGYSLPINQPFPSFPVENALAVLANTGNSSQLAALGVAYVISRPYLNADGPLLENQTAFSAKSAKAVVTSRRVARPFPLAAVYSVQPQIVSIGNSPDEYAVFVGDTGSAASQFTTLRASRQTTNPAIDWVDSRLAYMGRPEWGTAFGGVATSSRKALLLPPNSLAILAETTGRLRDDRARTIATADRTLHWYATRGTTSVTCVGICTIALASKTLLSGIPEHAWERHFAAVPFRRWTPWLVKVSVPDGAQALRYNTAYSPFWIAVKGGEVLSHARLDESLNLWTIATRPAGTIFLINILAALQFALEVSAFFFVLFLAWNTARQKYPNIPN